MECKENSKDWLVNEGASEMQIDALAPLLREGDIEAARGVVGHAVDSAQGRGVQDEACSGRYRVGAL